MVLHDHSLEGTFLHHRVCGWNFTRYLLIKFWGHSLLLSRPMSFHENLYLTDNFGDTKPMTASSQNFKRKSSLCSVNIYTIPLMKLCTVQNTMYGKHVTSEHFVQLSIRVLAIFQDSNLAKTGKIGCKWSILVIVLHYCWLSVPF